MMGQFYPLVMMTDWALPLSANSSFSMPTNIESAKAELSYRLAHRTELALEEKQVILQLGVTILEADFYKIETLARSFGPRPAALHRIASILARELRYSEVAVLGGTRINWKAPGESTISDICILSLRLERHQRVINISTSTSFGSQVLAPGGPMASGKLVLVNEDPCLLLRRIGTVVIQGPPPLTGGSAA